MAATRAPRIIITNVKLTGKLSYLLKKEKMINTKIDSKSLACVHVS